MVVRSSDQILYRWEIPNYSIHKPEKKNTYFGISLSWSKSTCVEKRILSGKGVFGDADNLLISSVGTGMMSVPTFWNSLRYSIMI